MVRAEAGRRPAVAADRLIPAATPPTPPPPVAATRAPRPLVIVAGPTGSGKSAMALALADALAGTVINVDALQVYRDLEILTARPTPADEARVPHRLYGVLAAGDACSAGRWQGMARAAIDEAWAAQRLPIVTGGTGLYIEALLHGLAPVPIIPPEVRAAGTALLAADGAAAFRARLAQIDAGAAARLPAGDRQRLLRAWEVVTATGRTLADWQRAPATGGIDAAVRVIRVLPPRSVLYPALDARFHAMLDRGVLAEVAALAALPAGSAVHKAIGARPLAAHLRGETTLADACAAAQRETRRYAKRQETWFRHRLAADIRVDAQYSERLRADLFADIRRFLLTGAT